jgi:ClpP class serine protease
MKPLFWLGSDESYEAVTKARELAITKKAQWEAKNGPDAAMPEPPPLYERVGSVGVIKIQGSLIQGAAEWMRYFGVTGYDDIKAAAVQGLADKDAKTLMIFSDSGGGAVAGLEDAETFLRNVSNLKPMSAYSEFSASAAYWLTSVASHITTGQASVNGSLGILRVHTDYSKAMEKEGVTKTILRAGRYKALFNSYEPLSAEALAEEQSKLDDLYGMFMDAVARNRGTTKIIADQVMGQGREFLGKRGVEAGLVDAVGNFDDALAYARSNRTFGAKTSANFGVTATAGVAQARAIADNAATSNILGTDMHLTPDQLAAIAAGASVDQVVAAANAAQAAKTPEQIAAEAAAAQAAIDQAAADAVAAAEAAAAEAAAAEAAANPEAAALKAELATAQAENATLQAQVQAQTGEVAALKADLAAVTGVVQASVKNLNIAMGKTVDLSKLSATELVAAHAEAGQLAQEKFKVGTVARNTAATTTTAKPVTPLIASRDAAAMRKMFDNKVR